MTRLSLRVRVLCLVALINAVVFGAGGWFVLRAQVEEKDLRAQKDLLLSLKGSVRPDAANVAYILQWPEWDDIDDAVLVDSRIERAEDGSVQHRGVFLNPVGRSRRSAEFDYDAVLSAVSNVIETGERVDGVEGGSVVRVDSLLGVWGGLWYRTAVDVDRSALLARLVPWFLLSTVLLTAGTFLALRQLVLKPVEQLAEGARRVRAGDFSVRLIETDRRDEMADLVRSFNAMTSQVHGFNEQLESEVELATDKARRAEAAAMTQRRLAAMGELAAGIAHEINNPLGGLQNAVDTLGREDLAPEKREQYLGLLARGLLRIGETVHRLRRFTPREAPQEEIDLETVVHDSVDLVKHRAERSGVAIELELASDLGAPAPSVLGARNEIGQALLNLLANSLDALDEGTDDPKGARIRVSVRRADPEDGDAGAILEVVDNGPGVSEEQLERVSDLFYTTKEVGKGTGLGLALVHNTMGTLGGRVKVSSDPGRSFSVELWFPSAPGRPALRDPEGTP